MKTGLDYLAENQARRQREHDHAVANYGPDLIEDALQDLNARRVWDTKSPIHLWIMNRRAALQRRANHLVSLGF